MAVGLPTKANWAAGDILTAAQMDDLAGTVNLLQYSAFPIMAGKNAIINGGMDIWQRGTASTAIGTTGTPFFLADRWQAVRGGFAAGGSVLRQATNDTTNLPFIQYAQRVQRDSGNTSTASLISGQNFESINSIPFAGKTVTLSYYARAGANYSPTSSLLNTYLNTGTGTDQNNLTSAFTGLASPINGTVATLTTTWQRFSFTATLSSTATQICIQLVSNPTGTAGANDYFEFTGVQLELGSTATTFSRAGGSIGGELSLAQRYYFRTTPNASVANVNLAQGLATSTTVGRMQLNLPVNFRTTVNAIDFSNVALWDGVTLTNATNVTNGTATTTNIADLTVTVAAGLVTLRPYQLLTSAVNGYVGVGAEL